MRCEEKVGSSIMESVSILGIIAIVKGIKKSSLVDYRRISLRPMKLEPNPINRTLFFLPSVKGDNGQIISDNESILK